MSVPEPIILVMPDGLTVEAMDRLRETATAALRITGHTIVCVPHGTQRAAKRVEHSAAPIYDEAIMALPRIATALEDIAEHMAALARASGQQR